MFTASKMRKVFKFDKVAAYGGRKINQPEVEVELRYDNDGRAELSICANLWNALHTDIIMGGQCLDTLKDEFHSLTVNSLFLKLYRLWRLYHLNSMHAGTEAQEQALSNWHENIGKRYVTYEENCNYLESIGLLDDNGYKYGSSWLYREIPEDDLNEIKSLINGVSISED
ncbi:MAG: hypothetical protein J5614_04795 [Paludibacteraceae bacterium]|nr:hypothetical protein [Paludibacteraceae bacterium]